MELILKAARSGKVLVPLVILVIIGAAFAHVLGLDEEGKEELLYFAQDYLPICMFLTLACLLFSGFPVAFILGGLALLYGLIGYFLEIFSLIEFFNFLPRIWGQAAENLVLVAVPAFVFMGVMMERSGIANDLLYCVQVLLKRVPGALALAVTIMGTILAAMTGIIGASVTMMTALALPTMMRQGYSHGLACGTIAASGTLGILIPPSIMLIIMADLLSVSVGNVFMAAIVPGLTLATHVSPVRVGHGAVAPSYRTAAASRSAPRPAGGDAAADPEGVHSAGAPDHHDQGSDPLRVLDSERGRGSRRVRRDAAGMVQRAAEPQGAGAGLPYLRAHRRDDLLHHHQRDLLRLRVPLARRRRHRRAHHPRSGPEFLGAVVPPDGDHVPARLLPRTGSRSP